MQVCKLNFFFATFLTGYQACLSGIDTPQWGNTIYDDVISFIDFW